jgi:hypothetical protein
MQSSEQPDPPSVPESGTDLPVADPMSGTISVCVWCADKDTRIEELMARFPGVSISHGICRPCMEKEMAKIQDGF